MGTGCTDCKSGNYPTGSIVTCSSCTNLPACADCDRNDPGGVCTRCITGHYLVFEGVCGVLPDTDCKTQVNDVLGIGCAECKPGYYRSSTAACSAITGGLNCAE